MVVSASGIFVFKCADGLWGRGAENAILHLYRKALILASELIRPQQEPLRKSTRWVELLVAWLLYQKCYVYHYNVQILRYGTRLKR